jgi:mannose-6-phosphate isomerase-like protein (cupin superfamily)
MSDPFTHTRLTDVKDSAADFGHGEAMEVRFAQQDVGAEETGLSHHRVKPNKRQPFGHNHEEAEEVYVVIRGSGRMKLDGEVIEVEELDAIRVAPQVTRAFEAGEDGLEYLAFGVHHKGDGEIVPGWWSD